MKINIHTSHPSAFISSTFLDLQGERAAVAQVLRESNLNINALDIKPASSDSSKSEIIRGIIESDFLVLIIGFRYGSIIPEMTGSNTLSITWWEYQQAKRSGKDILVYFKNQVDKEEKIADVHLLGNQQLAKFKKVLTSNHNPNYFSTPEELANKVKIALIPTYRAGVKRLLGIKKSLEDELESLRRENSHFKGIIQKSAPVRGNSLSSLRDINFVSPADADPPTTNSLLRLPVEKNALSVLGMDRTGNAPRLEELTSHKNKSLTGMDQSSRTGLGMELSISKIKPK